MNEDKKDTGGLASDKTLRDYFAGQALIGVMTNPELLGLVIKEQNKGYPDRMERFAFEVADAMIKERNK